MKKTSVYLGEVDLERLRRLSVQEGRSQAEIIRCALALYEARPASKRRLALTASGAGDGRSVADIPEDELLKGFGADACH